MGKKRGSREKSSTLDISKQNKEGTKTYALPRPATQTNTDKDGHLKVTLKNDLQKAVVDLIIKDKASQAKTGAASLRISAKKLTDLYMCLYNAGFKHADIEPAMSSTVPFGGDVVDALDWLCLTLTNDQLPDRFSETLQEEEDKKHPRARPTFAQSQSDEQRNRKPQAEATQKLDSKPDGGQAAAVNVKDWILQYAGRDSSSEEEDSPDEEEPQVDLNEKYLELAAKLLEAKVVAQEAKRDKNKSLQTETNKQIRSYIQDITLLESRPDFDPALREQAMTANQSKTSIPDEKKVTVHTGSSDMDGCDLSGFDQLEQAASAPQKTPSPKKKSEKLDKRSFAYTRQQWTGKSPKQFFIDWVRKHLPKSPPAKYEHVNVRGNLWRSRLRLQRKNEDDICVMPDIVCENAKESEHVACTLALYQLCKGQRLYTLLPPPYRVIWLEWQDSENNLKQAATEQENKPRDQFVKKLLTKLKQGAHRKAAEDDVSDGSVEESWENLADEDDQNTDNSRPARWRSSRSKEVSLEQLRKLYRDQQQNSTCQQLLQQRQRLPVYQYKNSILETYLSQQVIVVAGETGSGKSTQIPQFILEELLLRGDNGSSSIICTQPRRISATSLATRVCQEIGGNYPGVSNSLCGYQIRFEAKKCATTRLLYCTTGVLLRKLQSDPQLKDVAVIIVDEVHERSVQSDFLLIILRNLLRTRRDLKVLLMSATADTHKFSAYFSHCPVINIPGRTFPVEVFHMEDIVEMTGFILEEDSPYSLPYEKLVEEQEKDLTVTGKGGQGQKVTVTWTRNDLYKIDQSGLDSDNYSLKTRNTVTRINTERINMDLIVELLHFFDKDSRFEHVDGAVLVFLPGLSHIQELNDRLQADRSFSAQNRYKIVVLHSILSTQSQNEAFDLLPSGMRKIVLATNIAETSITIPDVVFVIDAGRVKENRYVESRQMGCLEEVYISKASAAQRQGRAGRVKDGFCFRLYTQHRYKKFKAFAVPEILRVPLEELCLHVMKCELGQPVDFLNQALDPPEQQTVQGAMLTLRNVGACEADTPTLTPLGHHLAALPVNVRIGKMMIFGAMFGCLEAVSVIAALMVEKSPFLTSLGTREKTDSARAALSFENSDQLTTYNAYIGWKKSQTDGYQAQIKYCWRYCLDRISLLDIQNTSRNLYKMVTALGFEGTDSDIRRRLGLDRESARGSRSQSSSVTGKLTRAEVAVLKAVLTAGLYPNVGKITYTAPVDAAAYPTKQHCMVQTAAGVVKVHPSSVNKYLATNGWLAYHEKIKLRQVYITDCTLISPLPLLLFGGQISVEHHKQLIAVEDWITFTAFANIAVIFKEVRSLVNRALMDKLQNPASKISDNPVVKLLVQLIVSESER